MTKTVPSVRGLLTLVLTLAACQETHSPPKANRAASCALIESASVSALDDSVEFHVAGEHDGGSNDLTYTWSTTAGEVIGSGSDLTVECSALDRTAGVVLAVTDGTCSEERPVTFPADSCLADIAGAYDLHFDLYTPQDVRIYLVRTGKDAYAAQIEAASPVTVTTTASSVKLVGWVRTELTGAPGKFEADGARAATEISLARDSTGALSGEATIAIAEDHASPVLKPATLARALQPVSLQLTSDSSLRGVDGLLTLPWAEFSLSFGRGIAVSEADFERQLRVTTGSGNALEPMWTYFPENTNQAHVGAILATTHFPWDDIQGETLTFELPEGFADALGTAPTRSPSTASIAIADVGEPAPSHEFAGPSLGVAASAKVALERGSPACEDSCARIGPVQVICEAQTIAGVLDASAAHKVVLRTRIASSHEISHLDIDVGLHGDDGQETGKKLEPETKPLADLGASAGTYHFASPWRTTEIELPGSPQRVGFELRVDSGCHWSTSPSPPEQSVLLVDRIAVE